jgi:hypothetical protein
MRMALHHAACILAAAAALAVAWVVVGFDPCRERSKWPQDSNEQPQGSSRVPGQEYHRPVGFECMRFGRNRRTCVAYRTHEIEWRPHACGAPSRNPEVIIGAMKPRENIHIEARHLIARSCVAKQGDLSANAGKATDHERAIYRGFLTWGRPARGDIVLKLHHRSEGSSLSVGEADPSCGQKCDVDSQGYANNDSSQEHHGNVPSPVSWNDHPTQLVIASAEVNGRAVL